MDLNKSIQTLTEQFKSKPWFHDVGTDQYGRLVIYTNYMCQETLHDTPHRVDGIQVLVHLAGSKLASKDQFVMPVNNEPAFQEEMDLLEDDSLDLDLVGAELDKLEKMVGIDILDEIFFEVHDKHNAITNHSVKFPEVKERMVKLYNQYGFDVIYDQI